MVNVENVTPVDAGNTALHLAACEGNVASLKVLVEAGADTEREGANGFRAVDYAAAGKLQA